MSAKQHNGMLPWKLRSFRSLRRQRASATNQQSDTPLDAPFTTVNDEDDVSHRGPSEGEEENSPAPRRVSSISMFKRGSEFGEATAMLRRLSVARLDSQSENLSRESSPSIVPPRTRSMVRFEAVASVQRRQSQLMACNSSVAVRSLSVREARSSLLPLRPHVAIIIVVSTFRDASIPNCRGVWGKTRNKIAKLLREDCAFDYVSLLTSESPETPDHTTTMTGVRREIQRVIQRFLVDDRNPSIVVIALGRGGVVPVGSVSGIGTHSTALVPYPSVAYAAATHAPRAKQPSPAVKVALLETAVVANGLQSTDVITPEMFQEIFQWNGKICKPAAVFFDMQETPGLPAKYGRDFSASSSSQPEAEACCVSTGFCSWTVPEYPAASFVSVYKAGQRAIGSFYLLKLLRGGILQSAIKEFGNPAALYATRASLDREGAPSPSFLSSMSPIPLPHYITRHIQSRLAIYPSDVHYYLVKKLMGRNCNTLFLLDLHVRGMDAGEDNGEGSPTFATTVKNRKNRIAPRPAFSEPFLFQLPSSDVVSPPSGGSPLEVLAKLSMANSALIGATHVPSDTVTMQLVVPMPLWRRNDDNMLTTASTDGHGRRPNPVLFEQQAARFRVSLHSALMKVFKGKNSIVASLMQQSWVTDVSVDHEALAFTLALQSGLTTSAVDDCATTVQTACNTSTSSSEERNPSFDPFEVEVNAATCVIVATAHRNAIRGRSGASSPPSVTNVDRIANRILHDAMTAGVPCKELTVSVIVQLALPSRDLYRKVDKVLRLGVLRQALSNESYVLVQPCPL
ncbi:Hypothetical protein, putative [Bodo saltans]|uniref:Uncharacterized protein n=1 Tax=Bodo saltans TaxID=75058 RepID=A0A0S4J615_BODSA|nr:Hypothetical protein, putative [Bodo saltans]|eukprot:CUG86866.1 Hypothetical protein, putative [Bodo saltans]